MITEAILNGFYAVVTFVLGLLPSLPAMPETIANGSQAVVNAVSNTVGVISYIYTPTVLIFVFVVLVAILNFDAIYKLSLWIYHKVRG